jgi:hypothetical protein
MSERLTSLAIKRVREQVRGKRLEEDLDSEGEPAPRKALRVKARRGVKHLVARPTAMDIAEMCIPVMAHECEKMLQGPHDPNWWSGGTPEQLKCIARNQESPCIFCRDTVGVCHMAMKHTTEHCMMVTTWPALILYKVRDGQDVEHVTSAPVGSRLNLSVKFDLENAVAAYKQMMLPGWILIDSMVRILRMLCIPQYLGLVVQFFVPKVMAMYGIIDNPGSSSGSSL